jgi:hypothetical protein
MPVVLMERDDKKLSLDDTDTGVYAEPFNSKIAYDFREMMKYCKKKGLKEPAQLSEAERKKFEI